MKNLVAKCPKQNTPNALDNFERGVKALKDINDPQIPAFMGYYPVVQTPEGPRPCVLMEKVEGNRLKI